MSNRRENGERTEFKGKNSIDKEEETTFEKFRVGNLLQRKGKRFTRFITHQVPLTRRLGGPRIRTSRVLEKGAPK